MFDTHAIARRLASADSTAAQVDAITDAVREAADHSEQVTPDQQRADLASLRADIYRAMLIQTAGTIGGTVALLRLLN
ncbi:MAG: hypothetical protein OXN89_17495 [Bryobacterales bacterium]|nr:hypothetical protein [Bryobacterales bacterium]